MFVLLCVCFFLFQGDMEVRVARIFNTFGPRMHPNDGRVVSNFIIQAIQGKDITIYGTVWYMVWYGVVL